MKKDASQPIGDVVKNVVEGLNRKKEKDINKIYACWPAVAGKEFCRHSSPVGLKKGTLLVSVDDSAWFYQINLQKEKLLESLKQKIGENKIQQIQFRIGKV